MADQKKAKDQKNEPDSQWEGFKDFVEKMAQVPKEELNEKLAQEKREKKERRAG